MTRFAAVVLLASLAGCSSHYEISTLDNQQFRTQQAPVFDKGVYSFKDADGAQQSLSFMKVKAVSKVWQTGITLP